MNKFSKFVFLSLQYILPKQFISRQVGKLASTNLGWFTRFAINRFASANHIDLSVLNNPDLSQYKTFNDFFARSLREGCRPIVEGENEIASPVDGTVSQLGPILQGRLIQAKGIDYSLKSLLGGSEELAETFRDGSFITQYLSPRDYHRIHMPYTGRLLKTIFIPGTLYSVNPLTASHIEDLYTKNERLVCIFETDLGKMAVIFVGATIVGSIATSWSGIVTPSKIREVTETSYESQNLCYTKGAEIGKFLFGSTVISCFEKNRTEFAQNIAPQTKTIMGQLLGTKK